MSSLILKKSPCITLFDLTIPLLFPHCYIIYGPPFKTWVRTVGHLKEIIICELLSKESIQGNELLRQHKEGNVLFLSVTLSKVSSLSTCLTCPKRPSELMGCPVLTSFLGSSKIDTISNNQRK